MEECSFYSDDHVAVSKSGCSVHQRHPIDCALELWRENKALMEALEDEKAVAAARKTMVDNWVKEAEVAKLQKDAALKMLKRVEWVFDSETGRYWCPVCENASKQGHTEDCDLGFLLQGAFSPLTEKRKCEHDWEPYILGTDVQCTKCKMLKDGGPQ